MLAGTATDDPEPKAAVTVAGVAPNPARGTQAPGAAPPGPAPHHAGSRAVRRLPHEGIGASGECELVHVQAPLPGVPGEVVDAKPRGARRAPADGRQRGEG